MCGGGVPLLPLGFEKLPMAPGEVVAEFPPDARRGCARSLAPSGLPAWDRLLPSLLRSVWKKRLDWTQIKQIG